MLGLNNNVVIFLDNDLVLSNVFDQEGLIVVESVLINQNGLILHGYLNFLYTISSNTVNVLLSLEETLVEGLEGMIELNNNLIELEWVLNQISLSEDYDLRIDVIKHNENSLVLKLANNNLTEEKNWKTQGLVVDFISLDIESIESVDKELHLVQASVDNIALIGFDLSSLHLSVIDVLLDSLIRVLTSGDIHKHEFLWSLAMDLSLLTNTLEFLLWIGVLAAGSET